MGSSSFIIFLLFSFLFRLSSCSKNWLVALDTYLARSKSKLIISFLKLPSCLFNKIACLYCVHRKIVNNYSKNINLLHGTWLVESNTSLSSPCYTLDVISFKRFVCCFFYKNLFLIVLINFLFYKFALTNTYVTLTS